MPKTMNRWWVVPGAIAIQLGLGAIYAWSAFTGALSEAGWSRVQTQAVFATELAVFAPTMLVAGRLLARIGPARLFHLRRSLRRGRRPDRAGQGA